MHIGFSSTWLEQRSVVNRPYFGCYSHVLTVATVACWYLARSLPVATAWAGIVYLRHSLPLDGIE